MEGGNSAACSTFRHLHVPETTVKKSSLFEKFMQRWRPASGVRVEPQARGGIEQQARGGIEPQARGGTQPQARTTSSTGSTASAAKLDAPNNEAGNRMPPPVERLVSASPPPATIQPEPAVGRKLSSKEEAAMAIGEGFDELSSIMRGVTVRLEDQGGRVANMAHDMAMLPELGRAQLNALEQLLLKLDRQGDSMEQVAQRLVELPNAMAGLQGALDRVVASDDRAAATLAEFRSNMDRIQSSMQQMVEGSRSQADSTAMLVREQGAQSARIAETVSREGTKQVEAVRGAVDDLNRTQQRAVDKLDATQAKALDGLRMAHEDQANRLGKVAAESSKWNRAVLVLLIMVFATLASIFVVLLQK